MKYTWKEISRLDIAEEKLLSLNKQLWTLSKMGHRKNNKKMKSISELLDNFQQPSIGVIGVPEKKRGAAKIFEEIVVGIFLNLIEAKNPQIQYVQ